jgi:hypothetical protein
VGVGDATRPSAVTTWIGDDAVGGEAVLAASQLRPPPSA